MAYPNKPKPIYDAAKDLSGIPDCHDAHIKTALAQIFPNAVFKDKYRY
jgi:hypothetical protein